MIDLIDSSAILDAVMIVVVGYGAKRMISSVDALNIKIAEVLKELGHHDWRLTQLEDHQRHGGN